MNKSVRKIVSLILSTCLVASMSAFSVSADSEDLSVNSNEVADTQPVVVSTEAVEVATEPVVADSKSANDTDKAVEVSTDGVESIENDINLVADTSEASSGEVTVSIDGSASESVSDSTIETVVDETTIDLEVTNGINTTNVNDTLSTTAVVTSQVVDVTEGVTTTTTQTVINTTKDVILTLDISDSMQGEPTELVRQTAIDLVNKILAEDSNAKIALVGFNDSSYHLYNTNDNSIFFNDAEFLIDSINEIIDGTINLDYPELAGEGGTDFLNALYQVQFLLETGDGEEKSVVIMTDGISGIGIGDGTEITDTEFFGQQLADSIVQDVLDFANNEIKPLATIYTIGYLQNLDAESQEDAKNFLDALASEGTEGAKSYYANDKNIDEITDLITEDIVHHEISKPKSTDAVTIGTSNSDSPNTSDNGVASLIVLAGIAGAMLVVTKKNK